MSVECDFCKKIFSSKSNLYNHQKKTKYCIELQGKERTILYDCKFCGKNFTSKQNQIEHSCKKRDDELKLKQQQEKEENTKREYEFKLKEQENIIYNQKEYIAKLEGNIAKLEAKLEKFEDTVTSMVLSKTEKKPHTTNTTTTNTTNNIVINNTLNLNDIEKMNSFLDEKLDKEVLAGGQKSFALLMSSTMLKDKYKCVDPSRQNFEFTNELGEIERDVKAKKLTTAIIKSNIRSRSGEKGEELWKKEDGSTDSLRFQANSKNVIDMINFDIDNSTFRSELTALT